MPLQEGTSAGEAHDWKSSKKQKRGNDKKEMVILMGAVTEKKHWNCDHRRSIGQKKGSLEWGHVLLRENTGRSNAKVPKADHASNKKNGGKR